MDIDTVLSYISQQSGSFRIRGFLSWPKSSRLSGRARLKNRCTTHSSSQRQSWALADAAGRGLHLSRRHTTSTNRSTCDNARHALHPHRNRNMERMQSQARERRQRGVFAPFDGPAPRQRPRKKPSRDSRSALPQLVLDLRIERIEPETHETHHDSQQVAR